MMIEVNVTEVVVDVNVVEVGVYVTPAAESTIEVSTTMVSVELTVPVTPTVVDIEVGLQGPQGEPGPAGTFDFESLTEQQKAEIRGDVGSTSTNYTNVFLNSLLG